MSVKMFRMTKRNSDRTAHADPQLPIPESTAWYTVRGAAAFLGVHDGTIARWIKAGKLKAYAPRCAPDETARVLLFAVEVEDFGKARRLLNPETTQ